MLHSILNIHEMALRRDFLNRLESAANRAPVLLRGARSAADKVALRHLTHSRQSQEQD